MPLDYYYDGTNNTKEMAKNKQHQKNRAMPFKKVSHTTQERCYAVAKKLLRHFELDPDLLDTFSKKQKQLLLSLAFENPSIKAEKERTVPGRFVKQIREDVFKYMKTEFFGEPENKLTFIDMIIYGMSFYKTFLFFTDEGRFVGTPQEETVKQIFAKLEKSHLFCCGDSFIDLRRYLVLQTRSYSQVNFRLYGFKLDWEFRENKIPVNGIFPMRMKIQLTAQDCQSRKFIFNNIERKAFQMIYTEDGSDEQACGAVIQRKLIFPDVKEEENLDIWIQSHVLHRFKQRVDIYQPNYRNFLLQCSIIHEQHLIEFDNQQYMVCTIDDEESPIGYFTFFIRGFDMVINTFIPLLGNKTPEGKKIRQLLSLGRDDINYLGMDKLSFLTAIDFEKIPVLKQALIDSGVWKTKLAIDGDPYKYKYNTSIDEKKTKFVKSFFDKTEQHRTDLQLPEILS